MSFIGKEICWYGKEISENIQSLSFKYLSNHYVSLFVLQSLQKTNKMPCQDISLSFVIMHCSAVTSSFWHIDNCRTLNHSLKNFEFIKGTVITNWFHQSESTFSCLPFEIGYFGNQKKLNMTCSICHVHKLIIYLLICNRWTQGRESSGTASCWKAS